MNVDLGFPSPVLCDGARGRGFFLPCILDVVLGMSTLGRLLCYRFQFQGYDFDCSVFFCVRNGEIEDDLKIVEFLGVD